MLLWLRDKRVISRLLIAKLLLAFGLLVLYPLEADGKRVKVRGYYRKDGTYVRPHYRTSPDGNPYNNYSYPGNYNPNTGKITPGDPQKYLDRYYKKRSLSSSSSDFNKWLKDFETANQQNGTIRVRGYYRKDGTYVRPHYRTRPDGNPYNNYSYPRNYNPNIGKITNGDSFKYLEDVDSGWSNQAQTSRTQIRIPSNIFVNDGYFTVGATMKEVVAVQGTPSSFSESKFEYGFSRVYFRNGRVTSWDNSTLNPLNVKMVPAPNTRNRGFFTSGSSKDEVIAVQGTPSSFSESKFEYGFSRVYFRNGRVTSWDNSTLNPLNVKMVPAPNTRNRGFFTSGSSKDEVIAVQGTPSSFSESKFEYGFSRVYFRNGRVISWDNSTLNPLNVKMVPAPNTRNRGFFTSGSSKDEVIAVQGTPSSFSESKFEYGFSRVYFRNGRVISWDNSTLNPLKAR